MNFSRAAKIKAVIIVFSVFFIGLGIALLRLSSLGVDPGSSFSFSVSEHFGFSFGVVVTTVNLLLFIPAILFYRGSIGFGTIVDMFGVGFAADFWRYILTTTNPKFFSETMPYDLSLQLLILVAGILILGFFAAFYMAADMGLLPYDAIPFIIQRFTKWQFRWARVAWDSSFLIGGFLISMLDGTTFEIIGIGTLFLAVGLGPILNFVMDNIARPTITALTRGR